MVASFVSWWLAASLASLASLAAAAPDSAARHAPADSVARVVRRFPEIEVVAPLHDLGSSQVVHPVTRQALRTLPVDGLAGVLALQAGVVAQGEELHVRGGRAGDTPILLDGQRLNEPLAQWAPPVPLLALRGADLVSGAPDARYGDALAGVLDAHTLDPGARATFDARWQGDGGRTRRYDRTAALASGPLHLLGLGALAAVDATFDDSWLPNLRTPARHTLAGVPLGWRAENRASALVKLAPVASPRRFSAQVLASRVVREPYDPQWSLDGWTYLPPDPKDAPIFSTTPKPGYRRYVAADHLAITDARSLGTSVRAGFARGAARGAVSLDWERTNTLVAVGGSRDAARGLVRPRYGNPGDPDRFHVFWGDDPLVRESGANAWALRIEGEAAQRGGSTIAAGASLTYEDVWMHETDWFPTAWSSNGSEVWTTPVDTVRTYHAFAPGGSAWVQERWLTGGMILNAGLRADAWTAGPQAKRQTLPGDGRTFVTTSPRLGLAYPVSVRDVFSFAYVRLSQPPSRDALYDHRTLVGNREPLGNPALVPATVVSYEAAVKHVFDRAWALQVSVFVRDLWDQVGTRWVKPGSGPGNVTYTNGDEGHVTGIEWSVVHERGEQGRFEAHYTWMQATGNESRSEGDPYGGMRDVKSVPIADTPLSWDQRHTLSASGAWTPRAGWSLAWSSTIASALPWTPRPVRQPFTDYGAVNSRRMHWSEATNLDVRWTPKRFARVTLDAGARNLFDHRGDRIASVDGYPNPYLNTIVDDYGAYRTVTGRDGGGYLETHADGTSRWVAVHDPRLGVPPRALRVGASLRW